MNVQRGVQLLAAMVHNLRQWDQSVTAAEKIITDNQELLEDYQQLAIPADSLTETMGNLLAEIIRETGTLKHAIELEKQLTIDELNQASKKDKMVNSYLVQQNSSVFVDKDF